MRFGRKGLGGTVALTIAFLIGSCGGGGGGGGGGGSAPQSIVLNVDDIHSDGRKRSLITVSFNKEVKNVATNSNDTACNASLLLFKESDTSSDKKTPIANKCVPLTEPDSSDNRTFTAKADSDLTADTRYNVRVSKAVTDNDGTALGDVVVRSIITKTQPTVNKAQTVPSDGSTQTIQDSLKPNIQIAFSEAMNAAIEPDESGNCTGSVQVFVKGNKNSCVKISKGTPFASADNKTFTVKPTANLTTDATYKIRLTDAITSAFGFPLGGTDVSEDGYSEFTARAQRRVTGLEPTGTGVFTTKAIRATFDEKIDHSTVTVDTDGGACDNDVHFLVATDSDYTNCIKMTGVTRDVDDKIFTVSPATPLTKDTSYWIKITKVKDSDGADLAVDPTTATFTTNDVDFIESFSPGDTSSDIPLNTKITVAFGIALDPESITTNNIDASCSGSLQVSEDGFDTNSSCVKMADATAATTDNKTFTATPDPALKLDGTYDIRLASGIRDDTGKTVVNDFMSLGRFYTIKRPTVKETDPSNGAINVARDISPTVTFDQTMDVTSITGTYTDTTCGSDTVQLFDVSADSGTCIQLTGKPLTTDGPTLTIDPEVSDLGANKTYKIKIANSIKSSTNGLSLKDPYETGFTTVNSMKYPTQKSPSNSEGDVAVDASSSVWAYEELDTSTFSLNTANNDCTGAFQYSSNDFGRCVKWAAAIPPITPDGDKYVVTLDPQGDLDYGIKYLMKVTTALKGKSGAELPSDKLFGHFFTVPKNVIWEKKDNGFLNYTSGQTVHRPHAVADGTNNLYITWDEYVVAVQYNQIRVKKMTTSESLSFVDGNSGYGIPGPGTHKLTNAKLAVIGNTRYLFGETTSNSQSVFKVYANTSGSTWDEKIADLDGQSQSTRELDVLVSGSHIYAVYVRDITAGGQDYLIAKKSSDGASWGNAIGGSPINADPSKKAETPSIGLVGSTIFVAWIDDGKTLTVATITDSANTKVSPSGGIQIGTSGAKTPRITEFDNKAHVIWSETVDSKDRIFVKKRTSGTTWELVGGISSSNGLNYRSDYHATNPHMISFDSTLYAIWEEEKGGYKEIRSKRLEKRSDNSLYWTSADKMEKLNENSSSDAEKPFLVVFNSKLYGLWTENGKKARIFRIK